MFPSSAIASPIFSSVWSLVFLGALRGAKGSLLPFGPQWLSHAQSVFPFTQQIRDSLNQDFAFDAAISEMLMSDWTLRSTRPEERDLVDLDMEVNAALGDMHRAPATSVEELKSKAILAAHTQLATLLDGLLVAERAAEIEGYPLESDATQRLVSVAHGLLGQPPFYRVDSVEACMAAVVSDWRRLNQSDLQRPELLRNWLAARLAEFPG